MIHPPFMGRLKDRLSTKNPDSCLSRTGVSTVQVVAILLVLLSMVPSTAPAQEIYFHYGTTRQTSPGDHSYAWGLTYLQGVGEYGAWSLTYLNEGHVTVHKRDGLAPQFWGRINMVDRRVSMAAGAGPYLYCDTRLSQGRSSYSDDHGVGAMFSLSATLYTESRLLLHVRSNWIRVPHSVNTSVTTIGVGYRIEQPSSPGPPRGRALPQNDRTTRNEIALLAGTSVLNEISHKHAAAESIEYRRGLGHHFDWTIGWLNEASHVSRTGPVTQFWVTCPFFDNHLSIGLGAGPYLAFDSYGNRDVTKVNWLVSATAHYLPVHPQWSLRFTWSRVATDHNRDADVVLAGVGYCF